MGTLSSEVTASSANCYTPGKNYVILNNLIFDNELCWQIAHQMHQEHKKLKMADVLDFDLRSIIEDDDFWNSNDEIILETQLTEVENYVEEIIYGVMSEIRRKKMRLDINNIYKYANRAGITEIETRKATDILKRKIIIESKTSKGKMESFRIVNKEMVYDIADSSIIPEENNIYLKKIYDEIGVLKKQAMICCHGKLLLRICKSKMNI